MSFSQTDMDGLTLDGYSNGNYSQNMVEDPSLMPLTSGSVGVGYTDMFAQGHHDSLVPSDQFPPCPQESAVTAGFSEMSEAATAAAAGPGLMGMEGNPHQLNVGGNGSWDANGSFDAVAMNNFHRVEGMGGPSQGYVPNYPYEVPLRGSSQQPYSSGVLTLNNNQPISALQQHANQYANTHAHTPAAFPPQLQRSSSNAPLPPAPSPSRNERVPIEREQKRYSYQSSGSISSSPVESPAGGFDQAMVVERSGPMSQPVTLRGRAKPGRKPMPPGESDDRRRNQNRMAQRKFRDNRQQKLQEALVQLEEYKKQLQQKDAEMKNHMQECRKQAKEQDDRIQTQCDQIQTILAKIESLQKQAKDSDRRANDAEARLQALQTKQQQLPSAIANFRPAYTPSTRGVNQEDGPTPPESENGMETDFTTWNKAGQSNYDLRQSATNDSNQMDYMLQSQVDDNCGFCSDLQNCVCAQEKAAAATAVEKPAPVSVPGSCDQCRNDPVRAQACRDMAAATQISTRPATLDSAQAQGTTTSGSMGPPPPRTCSNMIDTFNRYGERTASIASLFGGRRLNTYPASTGGGYEFQETEAAEVLSNLHRRSAVVELPRSVAKSAEEHRSPRT